MDDDKSKVYASFMKHVSVFNGLNQLPASIKFGEDVDVEKLVQHQAT